MSTESGQLQTSPTVQVTSCVQGVAPHSWGNSNLQLARLAVAAVPALGKRAAGALHVAGGQVVEFQRVLLQMPLGEALLDAGLPFDQPVHRCVELVLIDVAESKQFAQGGYRAHGGQRAGGGQLRARVDDAGDDKGNDEVAEAVGAAGDEVCTPSCLRIPNTAATWPWGRLHGR